MGGEGTSSTDPGFVPINAYHTLVHNIITHYGGKGSSPAYPGYAPVTIQPAIVQNKTTWSHAFGPSVRIGEASNPGPNLLLKERERYISQGCTGEFLDITTANITTMTDKALIALITDTQGICAVQETRLTTLGQQKFGCTIAKKGWKMEWGAPGPPRQGAHRDTPVYSNNAGVGIMGGWSTQVLQRKFTPADGYIYQMWKESRVICTSISRGAQKNEDKENQSQQGTQRTRANHRKYRTFYVFSVYGYVKAADRPHKYQLNEKLLRSIFDYMPVLGEHSPIFVCGDIELPPEQSWILRRQMRTGWGDILADFGDYTGTCQASPEKPWTRRDMIFGNANARRITVHATVLKDTSVRTHRPLRIRIAWELTSKWIREIEMPKAFSFTHEQITMINELPGEEKQLDHKMEAECQTTLEQLQQLDTNDAQQHTAQTLIDAAWLQLCQTAEAYLWKMSKYVGQDHQNNPKNTNDGTHQTKSNHKSKIAQAQKTPLTQRTTAQAAERRKTSALQEPQKGTGCDPVDEHSSLPEVETADDISLAPSEDVEDIGVMENGTSPDKLKVQYPYQNQSKPYMGRGHAPKLKWRKLAPPVLPRTEVAANASIRRAGKRVNRATELVTKLRLWEKNRPPGVMTATPYEAWLLWKRLGGTGPVSIYEAEQVYQNTIKDEEHAIAQVKRQRLDIRNERLRKDWDQQKRGGAYAWLRNEQNKQITVVQGTHGPITDLNDIDELARKAWLPIFREQETKPVEWEAFHERFEEDIYRAKEHPLPPIHASELYKKFAKMKGTAGGTDGWRTRELAMWNIDLCQILASLLNQIERFGIWPQALLYSIMVLLPKSDQPTTFLDYRPLRIMSAIYRAWGSARMIHLVEWQEKWVHPGYMAYRPGLSTWDLYGPLDMENEYARVHKEQLYGFTIDYAKCFDRLPIDILFRLCEEAGMDAGVIRALRCIYSQLLSMFKHTMGIGETWTALNGIMQGDPISVILVTLIITVWARCIEREIPNAKAIAFADDDTALTSTIKDFQTALNITGDFGQLTGAKFAIPKWAAFASTKHARQTLNAEVIWPKEDGTKGDQTRKGIMKVVPVLKMVGAYISVNAQKTCGEFLKRLDAVYHDAGIVRGAPLNFGGKVEMIARAVMPKLHAIAIAIIPGVQDARIRTRIIRTLMSRNQTCNDEDKWALDVFYAVCVNGAHIDITQMKHIARFNLLRQLLTRYPLMQPKYEALCAAYQNGYQATTGLVALVHASIKFLNWRWTNAYEWKQSKARHQNTIPLLDGPIQWWKHVIRDGLRVAITEVTLDDKGEFILRNNGNGGSRLHQKPYRLMGKYGIDIRCTRHLIKKSTGGPPRRDIEPHKPIPKDMEYENYLRMPLGARQTALLRRVLINNIRYRDRRIKYDTSISPLCEECGNETENTDHVYGFCPKTEWARKKYNIKWNLDTLPEPLRLCGTLNMEKEDVDVLLSDWTIHLPTRKMNSKDYTLKNGKKKGPKSKEVQGGTCHVSVKSDFTPDPPVSQTPHSSNIILHVFTDGSGYDVTDLDIARCGYGVHFPKWGNPYTNAFKDHHGKLPGTLQTVERSELYAAIWVLHNYGSQKHCIHMHIDASYVVDNWAYTRRTWDYTMESNGDLWRKWDHLRDQYYVLISKTKAHELDTLRKNNAPQTAIREAQANEEADQLAKTAAQAARTTAAVRARRDERLKTTLQIQRMQTEINYMRIKTYKLKTGVPKIGQEAEDNQATDAITWRQKTPMYPWDHVGQRLQAKTFHVDPQLQPHLKWAYCNALWPACIKWWSQLVWTPCEVGVSGAELTLDFEEYTVIDHAPEPCPYLYGHDSPHGRKVTAKLGSSMPMLDKRWTTLKWCLNGIESQLQARTLQKMTIWPEQMDSPQEARSLQKMA